MNVSKEHKLIWIPYPQSGERIIADFFGENGFIHEKNFKTKQIEKLSKSQFSFTRNFNANYEDFDIICSLDNPYRLIVNHFKKFSVINWSLKTNTKEFLSRKFNEWVHPVIFDDIQQIDLLDNTHFFLFPLVKPRNVKIHYLRVDKLEKDMSEMGIFNIDTKKINRLLLPDLSESYKDVFSYEHARIIYHLNKDTFNDLDYDPFSFTTRELSLKEKVDFIHN